MSWRRSPSLPESTLSRSSFSRIKNNKPLSFDDISNNSSLPEEDATRRRITFEHNKISKIIFKIEKMNTKFWKQKKQTYNVQEIACFYFSFLVKWLNRWETVVFSYCARCLMFNVGDVLTDNARRWYTRYILQRFVFCTLEQTLGITRKNLVLLIINCATRDEEIKQNIAFIYSFETVRDVRLIQTRAYNII